MELTLQPIHKDEASTQLETSWNVKTLQDIKLGGLLFQHQDGQTEFADNRKDCGSRQRLSGRLLPSQLHRRGQRVRQPGPTLKRGGVRPGAPKRGQPQGLKDIQLQSGLWEDGEQQEGDAVQLRPVKDLRSGANAEPCDLDVLQTFPGDLCLRVFLRHRLQAGSESLSRLQIPESSLPANWIDASWRPPTRRMNQLSVFNERLLMKLNNFFFSWTYCLLFT